MGDMSVKFRKFLLGLSRSLLDIDIAGLKFLYGEPSYGIPAAELDKANTGLELFTILMKRTIISEDKLDDFIDNLKDLKRNDLAQRCIVYLQINHASTGMHRSLSEPKANHAPGNNQVNNVAPSNPRVARVLPRSTSTPFPNHGGEDPDDRETPLKSVVGAQEIVESFNQLTLTHQTTRRQNSPPSQPIGNQYTSPSQPIRDQHTPPSRPIRDQHTPPSQPISSHDRSLGSTASTIWTSRSDAGLSSGDLVVDGPGSFKAPSSFGLHSDVSLQGPTVTDSLSPSFVASIDTLLSDGSLHRRKFAEQQQEMPERYTAARAAAANALIDREGVSSVGENNSIEFLFDVDSDTTGASSLTASHMPSSRSYMSGHGSAPRQQPPELSAAVAQLNPLVAGINSIVERVAQVRPAAPVNNDNAGPQFELFPQTTAANATEWSTQGARPMVPAPQQTSPPGNPRTVSFYETHERESRGRERTTDGHRDQNRVSSTREATYNPESVEVNGARPRRQSPSPPPRRRQSPSPPPRRRQRTAGKELRGYQTELAECGLAGTNCIICAPTGSGKTMTAGYICRERRKLNRHRGFKTLFIVCIRNLVNQQALALKEMFPEDDNVVKAFGEDDILKECIRQHDVVVVTAQIVVNSLQDTGRDGVDISDIDLLIMDECHHANLDHPYNNIMRVLLLRWQENRRARLPQVVGLTASLGVGGNKDTPIEHYITMCANLHCDRIEYVRDEGNRRELLYHNPKPSEDQIKAVPPRDNDIFNSIIRRMVLCP